MGARCNPPVCAVGDHVLLESKTEQVTKPPEPAQQELVVQASEQAGSRMIRNIPRTTNVCSVLDVFVSEDHGPLRVDVEVSSPLHGYEQQEHA